MSDSTVLMLLLAFMVLSMLFASIVLKGRKDPVKTIEDEFADRLARWLTQQVCLKLSVTEELIPKKALNRIHGAALKSARPLRQHQGVQIQLPHLLETSSGKPVHFVLDVKMQDVQHLIW